MLTRILLFIIFSFISLQLHADDFHPTSPKKIKWKFEGVVGSFDGEAVQRGYKVYKEVCAACHSMNKIAFRNLKEIGFSEELVKSIASSYQITDGPNDIGEMFERSGTLSDYFVPPFANKQAAMASNDGAFPPDLSLIIKARHDGANYVYSLLTGYENSQADENGLYSNPYFPIGKLSMAPPLSDGLVEYEEGRQSTVENMAYDVVNFLQWAAEPEMEVRHRLGLKVTGFLVVLTVFFLLANRRVWFRLSGSV
ncbi:cytochrome c1 [Candidatus Mesenet endosymbiont of Phosphuga atrata]|uniref:cytochrome c1 n=1 Tax=Candidatus Mesenet endosymbiont of Phosphuga atrata TaxID=3066221 RepID=UPI0030D080A2